MEKTFDYEQYKTQAVEGLLNGQPLTGTDGVLTPLIKEFLEAALAVELKSHIKTSKEYGSETHSIVRFSENTESSDAVRCCMFVGWKKEHQTVQNLRFNKK